MDMTVSEIAARVGGRVVGDGGVRVTGFSGIKEAKPGDLTFLTDPRYVVFLEKTQAAAVLMKDTSSAPDALPAIVVRDPYFTFLGLLRDFKTEDRHPVAGIHPTAVIEKGVSVGVGVGVGAHAFIGEGAELGDGVVVHPGVYVGPECRIGAGTVLYPGVVIRDGVRIGARCILHGNVVIGSDGFGFHRSEGVLHKVPQTGTVEIGDDVEIGANSAVDRATFGTTIVGRGTKIDNLVQIGHNVVIGEHCTISGTTGIAGSAEIGSHVTIAAQVGVAGHISVGDGAVVAGRSGVTKSIAPGQVVSGFPAKDHNSEKRIQACIRQLPDTLRRLRDLERRLSELEGNPHGETTDDSQ